MLELLVVAVFLQSVALVVLTISLSAAMLRLVKVADRVEQQAEAVAELRKDVGAVDDVVVKLGEAVFGK